MKKRNLYIILSIIIVSALIIIYFFISSNMYNRSLDVYKSDEVYLYQFAEGKGFYDKKATNSQKEDIWRFVENLRPTDGLETELAAGGYSAFYFKNKNEMTVFTLRKLEDKSFYVNVTKYNVNGDLINQYYFTTNDDLSSDISDIIIIK